MRGQWPKLSARYPNIIPGPLPHAFATMAALMTSAMTARKTGCYTFRVMTLPKLVAGLALSLFLTTFAVAQNLVAVEVEQFGVGAFRPGGLVPLRLKLTSSADDPLPVWVQWQVANADGDVGEWGRSLTLTPNQPAYPWLYAPLPYDITFSSVWTIRVFEERDGERLAEIGGTRINASKGQAADLASSMILVVGDRTLGLEQLGAVGSFRVTRPVGAHEDTRLGFGVKPNELPDRWDGLAAFDAVAWAGDNTPPQDLGVDQASALRQYVYNGGHLIISLPAAANPWGLGAVGQTQLEDLLPCREEGVRPRRDEAVPLEQLLPSISKFRDVKSLVGNRKQPNFTIQVFKQLSRDNPGDGEGGGGGGDGAAGEFNVIDNGYEPLIALPDGRVIVIQRIYGFGRVTVIGLDLSDGRFAAAGLPQADAFWNRVLGRRADTPTASELIAITDEKRLVNPELNIKENSLGSGPLFSGAIGMTGEAGLGLLLTFVLFVVYWLVAGPGGFAVLKQLGHVRHSWLAFAACAALFTAIAWGSVSLVPRQMRMQHVTFLDHVAQPKDANASEVPQYQRAVGYLSVYLPDYGSVPIALASEPDQRDLLLPWSPPGELSQPFPNVDRFRVDVARNSTNYQIPSRATATQFYAHWTGPLTEAWGGRLRAEGAITATGNAAGTETGLRGSIINELPGNLTDVCVIWVQNRRVAKRNYARNSRNEELPWVSEGSSGNVAMLNVTSMWKPGTNLDFSPGRRLDLASITSKPAPFRMQVDSYSQSYSGRDGANLTSSLTESDRSNYMEMLNFFQQLNPPVYLKSPDANETDQVVFRRELGRELDLSPWFNRPCLIIIGLLEDSRCPIPLLIDGQPVEDNTGLTVVRWVYPLPLDEKQAFDGFFDPDSEADAAASLPARASE